MSYEEGVPPRHVNLVVSLRSLSWVSPRPSRMANVGPSTRSSAVSGTSDGD